MVFRDRNHAGELLAQQLLRYRPESDIVIGLARGGIAVAAPIARLLDIPLDVLVVKKLTLAQNPEYAIGAVTAGGLRSIRRSAVQELGISRDALEETIRTLSRDVDRLMMVYRGSKTIDIHGKTVILVDDGIATGATFTVAIRFCKRNGAKAVIAVIPVAPPMSVMRIRPLVMDVVVLETPDTFTSVGRQYERFGQLTDSDVMALLTNEAHRQREVKTIVCITEGVTT